MTRVGHPGIYWPQGYCSPLPSMCISSPGPFLLRFSCKYNGDRSLVDPDRLRPSPFLLRKGSWKPPRYREDRRTKTWRSGVLSLSYLRTTKFDESNTKKHEAPRSFDCVTIIFKRDDNFYFKIHPLYSGSGLHRVNTQKL